MIRFEDANRKDIAEINSLLKLSKSYWNYSEKFINDFIKRFSVTEDYLKKNTVKLMYYKEKLAGIVAFIKLPDNTLELSYFFIHPKYIGKGLGKKMWSFCCNLVKTHFKYKSFIIWGDPNAEGFYYKMGCKKIGTRKSPLAVNRECPLMLFEID